MRINASGRNGAYVTLSSENPAELAFDATQVRNLVSNPSGGLVGGLPRLHIADSSDNELAVIPLRIPLIPRGKWRELSGASPYTVLLTDDEFRIEAQQTDNDNLVSVYNQDIARVQLVPGTARKFAFAENRADRADVEISGVNITIDAAGTSLTVASSFTHDGSWAITGVYVK